MIGAETLVRWFEDGATRPFLVEGSDGGHWAAKAHRSDRGSKHLFNELVVGRLASLIGLPWPEVDVLELSPQCRQRAEGAGLRVQSNMAVGLRFVPGLEPLKFPPGGFVIGDPTWEKRNREHILGIFPAPEHRAVFYGKNVFDNWVLMMNDVKYETLQRGQDGRPMFLDATYALRGETWVEPLEWQDFEIVEQSPYVGGVVADPAGHAPWLDALRNLDADVLRETCVGTPDEWELPADGVKSVQALLAATANRFVPLFERIVM